MSPSMGRLDDCTQLDTHFFGSFCQNFLVIEGYGTDEMYFFDADSLHIA